MRLMQNRDLKDLDGIGKRMLEDFAQLGIGTVDQLGAANPDELYERLCQITRSPQDVCVLDVFRCAVAQARDPKLPAEQRNWWWWSRKRKSDEA